MNQQDSELGTGSILLAFLVGGLIGAGVVMLTARKTGEETRKTIKGLAEEAREKAGNCIDRVKNMATGSFEKGKDFVEKESNIITKVVGAGKEAYEKEKHG